MSCFFFDFSPASASILQVNRVGVGGYWDLQNFQIGLPAGTRMATWGRLRVWDLLGPVSSGLTVSFRCEL